jgi:hypothetical protein
VTAFRGLAYLGAKADEQISTQRFLWETAAGLRYEKCLILAKRNWTEERKVKVAGFNGRYGMESLWGQDLDAQFVVEIQPDSTRPMSMTDKQQAFTMLLEGGMVDPTDPATREFIIDLANLNGVNLVSHLQYMKADRDLQSVIQGNIPPLNPYIDLNVFLKVFSSYTLTEEFEALPQDGQQRVLMATQMISEAAAGANGAADGRSRHDGRAWRTRPATGRQTRRRDEGQRQKAAHRAECGPRTEFDPRTSRTRSHE